MSPRKERRGGLISPHEVPDRTYKGFEYPLDRDGLPYVVLKKPGSKATLDPTKARNDSALLASCMNNPNFQIHEVNEEDDEKKREKLRWSFIQCDDDGHEDLHHDAMGHLTWKLAQRVMEQDAQMDALAELMAKFRS